MNPERFEELLFPQIEPKDRKAATVIAKGSTASPSAACGKVCFTQDEALVRFGVIVNISSEASMILYKKS